MIPHTIFLEQQMKNSEHLVSFSGVNNTLMGFNILIHVLHEYGVKQHIMCTL